MAPSSLTPSRRRPLRAILSDERGASMALVALSLVWMVGMVSLVVDIGGGWLTRQTLIPATDAAALAAAQDLVNLPLDEDGACTTAASYVSDNATNALMSECTVADLGPHGGRVTIAATEEFQANFTDLADDEISIQSVSTATWGPPLTVSELRPLALCYDGSTELRQLIDNPPAAPTWVEVGFVKDDPAACGGSPSAGNFATVDFEGGTGSYEIRDWMLNGYPGPIGFEPPTESNCDGGVTCYERPYASSAIMWELQLLRNRGSFVAFPVFDYADAAEIHLVGMVRARLYDFEFGGSPDNWRLELKVDPGLITGTCCGQPGILAGNKVIAICGVDPAAFLACEPSGGS